MEHQLLPKGAAYGDEDRVAYSGGTDYTLVPLLDYPDHAGFTFLTQSPLSVNPQLLGKESPTADFLLAWIFYALLREVLGTVLQQITGENLFRHEDFVQTFDHPANAALTTSKLNVLLRRWSDLIQPSVSNAAIQYNHLKRCLNLAIEPVLMGVASKLDGNVNRVLCSTLAVVSHCINHAFNDQDFARDFKCVAPLTGLFNDKRDLESMRRLGWCPAQADSLWRSHLAFNVFYYLEKMDRRQDPLRRDRHLKCSTSCCYALQAPIKSQHRDPQCDCAEVTIEEGEWRKLLQILQSNRVPLLRFTRNGENLSMEVISKDSKSIYVALSHVWADGLGNMEQNALRRCQVDYLFIRLSAFQTSLQITDKDLLFWIDTLCCPLKPVNLKVEALALMQETYRDAEHVMVFDSALENTDHTVLNYLEILARVLTSDWMRRLWTLQEAFLAQELWVQFSGEAISIDQLLIEHNEMDERVEAIMMYTFTRNFVFSIRRRRALKPSSQTFHIHTLALGITGRSVTDPSDEPLCLSTILNLDKANATAVARAPSEQRMKILWDCWCKSTQGVPGRIIFSDGPKLSDAGYRWAPSTLLRLSTPSVLLPEGFGTGVLCPTGLKVQFPGILLSSISLNRGTSGIRKTEIDRPSFIRDGKGLWYTITVGDLDAINAKVADQPDTFIQELMATKSPFPPDIKIEYCRYAVIMSGQDSNIMGSTNALLVHLDGNEGQTLLATRIQTILPPSIVHHSLGPILEAAFQIAQNTQKTKTVKFSADTTTKSSSAQEVAAAAAQGSAQEDGPYGLGAKSLAKDAAVEPLVKKLSANPAAFMQLWIENIMDGNFVALGQILPKTQEWCVD